MVKKKKTSANRRFTASGNKKRKIILLILPVLIITAIFVIARGITYIKLSRVDNDNPFPVKGVDVSSYQGDIDWKKIENQNISFAFIKATEGSTHLDSKFETNWEKVNHTDIRAGAYHFLSYDTDGRKQAENFISHVEKKSNMLPPVIDVEFYGSYIPAGSHPTADQMSKVLDPMLKMLEREYSMKPIIYTNSYIYTTYISGRYKNCDIWLSNPDFIPDNTATETDLSLSDGKKWTFCQYSYEGKMEGYSGGESSHIDLNVFYGNRWEFLNY